MFYILQYSYNPNTASCNRLLGFYNTLENMGIDTTLVFFAPNINKSRITHQFQHIRIQSRYNNILPYKKFIKSFLVKRSIKDFVKELRPGDTVYTYTVNKITQECLNVSGVKVYAEITEHPDVCANAEDPSIELDKESYNSCIRKLTGLFVISHPLKDYFVKIGLCESKTKIINMTVDYSRFAHVNKQAIKEKYIAYCGTASNTKDGVDELIRAFSIVSKQYSDLYLYIIGSTPKKRERFNNYELVKSLGIEDRVKFTGIIPSEEMPQMLKNAEVLALDRPNNLQAHYGFPTKLGEYLLTKNPVVVTSVGDIPDFLTDRVSALIAEPSNTSDFAEKLIWVLNNKEDAKKIGEEGCKIAMLHFNSETESKKMIRFMGL